MLAQQHLFLGRETWACCKVNSRAVRWLFLFWCWYYAREGTESSRLDSSGRDFRFRFEAVEELVAGQYCDDQLWGPSMGVN